MTDRPAERHAVIVSVARYAEDSGLVPYRSIDASAERLAELLARHSQGLWDSVVRVADPGTPHAIMDAVADGMRASRGGGQLLVYYIGHGERTLFPYPGIQLALTTSRERTPWSFLALDHVKAGMREHQDCSRALVLDCCYSADAGALGGPALPAAGQDAARQGMEARFGHEPDTCVLTAVSRMSFSQLAGAQRPDGLTHFSGLLIDLLRSGIPGAGGRLTVRDVYRAMGEHADARTLRPDLISRGTSTPVLFPNHAAAGAGHPDAGPDVLAQERLLAEATAQDVAAAWVRRHGPLAAVAPDRLAAFVARRFAEAPADHVARFVHCAHTYEEGDQEWLHDALSSPLLLRGALDSGRVLAALDAQGCADCHAFGRRAGRRIVEHGDPATLRELLRGRAQFTPSPGPTADGSP